jgi:anthranilate synthase component 1
MPVEERRMQQRFDIIADTDTPVSAYLKLAPLSPRYLLESVERGERLGRYSFIGFGDAFELRLDEDGLRVDGRYRGRPETGAQLLDVLRSALRDAPVLQPAIEELPFAGGLVGAASYDLARFFERLPARGAAREPDAVFVATRSLLAFDHLTRRAALLHDGAESERQALAQALRALLRGPLPAVQSGTRFTPPRHSLERATFLDHVARAKAHIRAGDVFQLVLSVSFEGETNIDPFSVYRALRLINPSPYMYYCDLGDLRVAGSSPEALVQLRGRRASLRPIAGTRPRGATPALDDELARELAADEKENAEHVMLVDLARNDLGRVAVPGSIVVEPYCAIERYSHVMHMVSGVSGELESEYDGFDLFAAAFPAGTLVGAPKVRAMQLIDELEPLRRGLYGGTVGYFGTGGGLDQAIAIRTLIFRDGGYRYQAGAGIVADSVPEAEHAEILAKGAAMQRALELAAEMNSR